MRKKRGKLRAIGLCLLALSLSGCWDQHPVEMRAAVAAIGIDPAPGVGQANYTFTFPNVTTTAASLATTPQSQEFYAIHVTAPNLLSALLSAQRRESRTLYLGQVRIVCLSSALPTRIWRSTLMTMADSGRFVLTTWIVGAPNAAAVVSLIPPVEVVPEVGLYNALTCRCQGIRWPGRGWRVWSEIVTPGITPSVVWVHPHQGQFTLTRLLVLRSPYPVSWSPEATIGWSYLTGRLLRDNISVTLDHTPLVVGLIRGRSHLAIHHRQSTIAASVHLDYSGVILGNVSGSDAIGLDRQVERQVANRIQSYVQAAWLEAQRTDTDPMGWHRSAIWSDAAWASDRGWSHWSLTCWVHFTLREEGVLR
ncbi:MAG: hypothetical protein C7B45_02880 [Sulfobacillus acidophilus]|uniref:Spore germination protein N-terminal domain-containing protein n=1 Tax=Sulfobacillus acidophilus TaxID=53633 RepID=A0A2T2WMN1_9FIRM|nr:MAG: hypothetical protein C7B45_02880 [Sulfobacillus acidophilus]